MIQAHELQKHYGEVEALRGISFDVPAGAVIGLLGPNGAGKTTTMRLLTTYSAPSGGTASVAGFDIRKDADMVRRSVGYLPEVPPLYPEMRVQEYLSFAARIRGLRGREVSRRVEETLEHCALGEVRARLCFSLSKGFRQRVGIAQALVHGPKVIILDEPTSGLDPAQIVEVRKLIAGLAGRHTVILSTHILQEVVETCSRVIIIARGRIVADAALAEFMQGGSLEQRFLEAVTQEEEHA